jgi:hypothetical protein
VRSSFLPQLDGAFEYGFESENGIKQQAVGVRKAVGDEEVIVMKGDREQGCQMVCFQTKNLNLGRFWMVL